MKACLLTRNSAQSGYTLIEVTLVISVILGLITVLLIGVAAYKKGSDRALCIQNIATVQKAMRSYCNLYGLNPGDSSTGLKNSVIGPGKFLETDPVCQAGGTYTYGGDTVPAPGVTYLTCSIADHVPSSVSGW